MSWDPTGRGLHYAELDGARALQDNRVPPMPSHRQTILLALAVAACGSEDPSARPDAAPSVDAASPDAAGPSADLFPTDRVLEVAITLAPADWDVLRAQEPLAPDATCDDPTATGSYTYFPASITIDGAPVANVGVRKKGNLGSLSTTRPGLKIKANEYVAGQRIAGLKQLTLNNNHQDDTLISQCLGYGLFRRAGLPAPRCAFAHVTVNGADLGVYSHVESVRDELLQREFGDDTGNLYESGGDFIPGATGGFGPKNDAADCQDLEEVATALQAPAAERAARVGEVLDLDEFMRFWAMEVVTGHWDGYANNRNNYFVYHDPTSDRLRFIPWGTDALFTSQVRSTRPQAVYACGSMAWSLYDAPDTRARYLAALRDVLDTVWDEAAILAEIDHLAAVLAPLATPDLDGVRAFVRGRDAVLRGELDAGDPTWPYERDESCLVSIGTITASFETTWDTRDMFPVGSGSMSGNVGATDVTTDTVYATAGVAEDGKATVQLLGQLSDGRFAVLVMSLGDPATFAPGVTPIDLRNAFAYAAFYDPETDTGSGGWLLLPGTITLTDADATTGAPVRGTITGTVIEL